MKEQTPNSIFEINDPPVLQRQVENGQLEKRLATVALTFDIGNITSDEHSVTMKNLTQPIIELHFMRHNSVVIDTTLGLIHFPHSKMQAKSVATEWSTQPLVCLRVHYLEKTT